jgi:hypothetical protein
LLHEQTEGDARSKQTLAMRTDVCGHPLIKPRLRHKVEQAMTGARRELRTLVLNGSAQASFW